MIVGALGALLGWGMRPLSAAFGMAEPLVPVWAVAVIWLLALGVAVRARQTWRALQRGRGHLEAYQAVNRLVLGQASALVGSGLLGGYLGNMVTRIGVPATVLTDDRLWRDGFAALGGLALLAAGLWLERACRVRPDPR